MKISCDKKKNHSLPNKDLFLLSFFFFHQKSFLVCKMSTALISSPSRLGCTHLSAPGGWGFQKAKNHRHRYLHVCVSLVTPPRLPARPAAGWEVPRERGGTASPRVSPSPQDRSLPAPGREKKARRYLVTSVMSSCSFSARHKQRRSARLQREKCVISAGQQAAALEVVVHA